MKTNEETSLELKKLALEIAELERPWWKRPSFVLASLPAILATLTLLYGLTNGYFSTAFAKLENQKIALGNEIHDFEVKRDALHAENDRLSGENAKIKQVLEGRTQEAISRKKMAEEIMMERHRCEKELSRLKAGK